MVEANDYRMESAKKSSEEAMTDGEQLDPETIATLRGGRKHPVYAGDNWHGTPDHRQVCAHEHREPIPADMELCRDCGRVVKR